MKKLEISDYLDKSLKRIRDFSIVRYMSKVKQLLSKGYQVYLYEFLIDKLFESYFIDGPTDKDNERNMKTWLGSNDGK